LWKNLWKFFGKLQAVFWALRVMRPQVLDYQ